ncbi:hypothetical protein LSAT2_032093 [Lamellibrachia satsuma]|nr:hypothetical protein LSAT2_032093 [Lamellibrachia satsuma]
MLKFKVQNKRARMNSGAAKTSVGKAGSVSSNNSVGSRDSDLGSTSLEPDSGGSERSDVTPTRTKKSVSFQAAIDVMAGLRQTAGVSCNGQYVIGVACSVRRRDGGRTAELRDWSSRAVPMLGVSGVQSEQRTSPCPDDVRATSPADVQMTAFVSK